MREPTEELFGHKFSKHKVYFTLSIEVQETWCKYSANFLMYKKVEAMIKQMGDCFLTINDKQ